MSFLDKIKKKRFGNAEAPASQGSAARAPKAAKAASAGAQPAGGAGAAVGGRDAYRILRKPVISEKGTVLQSAHNVYVFEVNTRASKQSVAAAVNEVYGVKPVAVRIVNRAGKTVTARFRGGVRRRVKKAYVQLPAGKTIIVHESV